jgi:surfeit locus 1 family protein
MKYFNNIQFKFKLVPTLVFLTFFVLFIRLGFWQLDRAEQKRIINDQYKSRQETTIVDLNQEVNKNNDSLLWRKAEINGSFYIEKNILLDNQIYNQTAGFNIITPFRLAGTPWSILVNRGWQPNLVTRNIYPVISQVNDEQLLRGHLVKFPVSGIKLGEDNIEVINSSIIRLQRIDLDEINTFYSAQFLPYMIFLDPMIDKDLVSNFSLPVPESEKNYGYAFQWFAFAVTLLVIFLKLGIKRKA